VNRIRKLPKGTVSFAALSLVLALSPFISNNYYVQQATFVCMYAALALSWNVIGGMTGYPSFSTAAFVGLGSYAGALLQNAGIPMVASWMLATLITAAFAALLGFAILRMKGHYFAIGSISIVEVLRLLTSSWSSFTGGGEGLNLPILPGGPDYAGRVFLYSMLVLMLCAQAMCLALDRSRLGFGLRCISQNEDAADMVGVNVNSSKIAAFVCSAFLCGTAGAVSASWVAYIAPTDAFSIVLTLKVPVMAMLGGAGTVFGPVLGALIFVGLEQTIMARFLDYSQAMLGVLVVALIFLLPNGVLAAPLKKRIAPLETRSRSLGVSS
jgi:branched-chain amino acid transport system permease protein